MNNSTEKKDGFESKLSKILHVNELHHLHVVLENAKSSDEFIEQKYTYSEDWINQIRKAHTASMVEMIEKIERDFINIQIKKNIKRLSDQTIIFSVVDIVKEEQKIKDLRLFKAYLQTLKDQLKEDK